jgi:hypothetical protein
LWLGYIFLKLFFKRIQIRIFRLIFEW